MIYLFFFVILANQLLYEISKISRIKSEIFSQFKGCYNIVRFMFLGKIN